MSQTVCPLISAEDRFRLEAIIADRNRTQKHLARARIILYSSDRLNVAEIARLSSVSRPAVWRWRRRFPEAGIAGLLLEGIRKPGKAPLPDAVRVLRQAACALGWHHLRTTKTGLATWSLPIYLVTSSNSGISAMELKRQLGFGSYQTAWTWLHKIRKAMIRPDRCPLSERVEADETYHGGLKSGNPGVALLAIP